MFSGINHTCISSLNIKVNGYTFKGSNSTTITFSFFPLFSQVNGKNLLPRSKFSPLRVGPILKGLCYPGKQTGNHKSCFPCKKSIELHGDVTVHHNCNMATDVILIKSLIFFSILTMF